jgi:thioredoxin reductase (NADPH)
MNRQRAGRRDGARGVLVGDAGAALGHGEPTREGEAERDLEDTLPRRSRHVAPDREHTLKLPHAGKIEIVMPYQLAALVGKGGGVLTAVTVEDPDGRRRDVPADVLLPLFGLAASLGPIAEWGLALERHQIAVDPASCETNQPGIYAIGDVAAYPGKLKLILTGFAEAARAAHSAYHRCRPGAALHWEYSTTKGVPGR